jgi:4-hydroxy-2-oxoheptanedioate aldolase
MAEDLIRGALRRKATLLSAWLTTGNALAVEIVARAGVDLAGIDQQHGAGGPAELVAMLQASRAARLPALVRVGANDTGLIGRALDAGAQGVICPMVNTKADAERLVSAVKLPPAGARSFGPYLASFVLPGDYFASANAWTIACAQIETAEALDNLDQILATAGLDMILVGPNDLSISLSGGKRRDPSAKETLKAIDHILARCRRNGVIAAIYAGDETYARPLVEKGWQVVMLGSDALWIAAGAARGVELMSKAAKA